MNTKVKKTRPRGPVLKVQVTPEIIERSKRADSRTCMIAEAIKVAHPGAQSVSVDIQTCRLTDPAKGLRYIYLTPRAAQKPLIDFDLGREVEPFEVSLKAAHVTRMRGRKKTDGTTSDLLSKADLRRAPGGRSIRVGGNGPPIMTTLRKFGLRAFIGSE